MKELGTYIKLWHGRNSPEENLDDWGFDGPTLGPFESVQGTYVAHLRCHPVRGPEVELPYVEDLIQHEGKFYGDFTVFAGYKDADGIVRRVGE
jgi:hypothetical protein